MKTKMERKQALLEASKAGLINLDVTIGDIVNSDLWDKFPSMSYFLPNAINADDILTWSGADFWDDWINEHGNEEPNNPEDDWHRFNDWLKHLRVQLKHPIPPIPPVLIDIVRIKGLLEAEKITPKEVVEGLTKMGFINPKIKLSKYVESSLWEEYESVLYFLPPILNFPWIGLDAPHAEIRKNGLSSSKRRTKESFEFEHA